MLSLAADDQVRKRVQELLAEPSTRLLGEDADAYLFKVEAAGRGECPEYLFFVCGRLLQIRRMGLFSDQYAFGDFPQELTESRVDIERRFASLSVMTEDGMGWFAPLRWEELSSEQQAICRPKFVGPNPPRGARRSQ
jgi:hypothetical protein